MQGLLRSSWTPSNTITTVVQTLGQHLLTTPTGGTKPSRSYAMLCACPPKVGRPHLTVSICHSFPQPSTHKRPCNTVRKGHPEVFKPHPASCTFLQLCPLLRPMLTSVITTESTMPERQANSNVTKRVTTQFNSADRTAQHQSQLVKCRSSLNQQPSCTSTTHKPVCTQPRVRQCTPWPRMLRWPGVGHAPAPCRTPPLPSATSLAKLPHPHRQ
jgi:hypothetical protein